MYNTWDIECNGQNFFVILDHFFAPLPPNNPKNQNFFIKEKNTWRYYHFTHVYHKWQSYDVWFLRYKAWQINFFVNLNQKNQNFEKLKKMPEDIIILHKCTKNNDHMLYCPWDMAHNRCNCYFSFWTIFCPFTLLTQPKKSKLKNAWRHHHFTIVYKKSYQKTWQMRLFFILGYFLPFYPPNSLKNQN